LDFDNTNIGILSESNDNDNDILLPHCDSISCDSRNNNKDSCNALGTCAFIGGGCIENVCFSRSSSSECEGSFLFFLFFNFFYFLLIDLFLKFLA
jgi:hypothetical protein